MIAEFIYCYLLRAKPLRELTNWIIKKLLPKKIKVGSSFLFLNPNDPVVSGALFFNVYERSESKFIKSICFKGMQALDIGANIGYYSTLISQAAGENGLILAIEPDPESYKYLSKTINSCKFKNILPFPFAASDIKQKLPLFISKDNRGDNRLYQSDQLREAIKVDCLTVDELLIKNQINTLDFIKIDVQGYEPKVFKGMKSIIKSSDKLILLTEFWPKGIFQAGENPKDFLRTLRELEFQLFELNSNGSLILLKKENENEFIDKYQGRRYTNLVGKKFNIK